MFFGLTVCRGFWQVNDWSQWNTFLVHSLQNCAMLDASALILYRSFLVIFFVLYNLNAKLSVHEALKTPKLCYKAQIYVSSRSLKMSAVLSSKFQASVREIYRHNTDLDITVNFAH